MAARPPGQQARRRHRLAREPIFEHVVTEASHSFLWRQDDYPCARNGWNVHPEIEIHLITNAAGITLVGDHIGRFEPGHLALVGSNLPHDWVTELLPGEVLRGRDVVLQFHPERVTAAAAAFPELGEMTACLALAQRGLVYHGETRRLGAEMLLAMGPARGMARLSLFMRLLELLSRSNERVALSSETFVPSVGAAGLGAGRLKIMQKVLKHIFDHITGELRLADMAALGGMSESQFSRFFKRTTGNSFTARLWPFRQRSRPLPSGH